MATVTFGTSYRQLKQAQKGAKGAPLYSLLVNRPVGRVLASAAHVVGLTPNQVTLISAVFTFSAIALIAIVPPSAVTACLIVLGLLIGYAFDSADGQLARLTGSASLTGEWLDHVVDTFKIATLHLAVLVAMYRFFDLDPLWMVVPLVAAAVGTVHFVGMLLTDLLARVELARRGERPTKQPGSFVMSLAKVPTDYGVLCLGFALWAVPWVFAYFYLIVTAATLAYTLLILFVWYRRLRLLDEAAGRTARDGVEEGNG